MIFFFKYEQLNMNLLNLAREKFLSFFTELQFFKEKVFFSVN